MPAHTHILTIVCKQKAD